MGGGTDMLTAVVRESASGREVTDETLIVHVRAGDDRAFEVLYERYRKRIAAYVHGMVTDWSRAEDITQDVFISALRRLRETDRPVAFKPWVYEIAKNACIDQFRRSRRADEVSYDADEGLGAADYGRLVERGPTPDAAVHQKQQLDHLCGAFGGLSASHHEILVLRELEGLSYREIGERMGLTRPAVESTLFRARRRLTEEYDELASGERCQRVRSLLAEAAEGMLGTRERRKLGRHLSHCQPCRRDARLLGVETERAARRPVAARIAAFVPLPAFLRRRMDVDDQVAGSTAGSNASGLMAQWSAHVAQVAEPLAGGWAKAAAAALTLAVASTGAGIATRESSVEPVAKPPARSAKGDDRGATSTRPAAREAVTRSTRTGTARGRIRARRSAPRTSAPAPAARRGTGGHGRTRGSRRAAPEGPAGGLPLTSRDQPRLPLTAGPDQPRHSPPGPGEKTLRSVTEVAPTTAPVVSPAADTVGAAEGAASRATK